MIEVAVGDGMIAEARRLAAEVPVLKNSIRGGEGTVYGMLGELLFASLKGATRDSNYEYDVVMPSTGVTIDVKTKCCTSPPRLDYECSVAAFNATQGCDAYVFMRVMKDLSRGWYLGGLWKPEFFESARFVRKGDLEGSNRWTATADCYSVQIKDLRCSE
jgi:hypothetical protein